MTHQAKFLANFLVSGAIFFSSTVWAQTPVLIGQPTLQLTDSSGETGNSSPADPEMTTLAPLADHYYTVYESTSETAKTPFKNPLEMGEQAVYTLGAKFLSLMKWRARSADLKAPTEKYMRKLHFGRWINDPTDDTCLNTRAKVLVRDSNADVTFKAPRKCVVESGDWIDPYTGDELTSSKDIQVDHLVPLKHAYQMGAWKWDYKGRCLYANFLGYKNHLISAGSHENMSKGDDSPAEYMPPLKSYQCTYIKSWLTVKLIWKLAMTEEETDAITEIVKTNHCSLNSLSVSLADLNRTRKFIKNNLNFCLVNNR